MTNEQNTNVKELYGTYAWAVLRRCRQMLGDARSAEDAMQEIFLKILEYNKPIGAGCMTSFIMQTATNYCINVLKSYSQRKASKDGDLLLLEIACSDDMEERINALFILHKLFKQHPVSSKKIAILHFGYGLTLEETAKEVRMSVSGVRKRLCALKKSLRKIINGDQYIGGYYG